MHYPSKNKVRMLLVAASMFLLAAGGLQNANADVKQENAVNAERVQKGKVLFSENCQVCHQEGGAGKPGVAPSLTNKELLSAASDRFLLDTIRDGRPDTAMPTFGQLLKDEEIQAIVSYLRSFGTEPVKGGMLDNDRKAMGDPRLGARWFSQVCAGCHGVNGEGYEGSGSGTAIGKSGFLGKASDGFIRYIIKNGRSNTPMRGFAGPTGMANLNEQEIDDIITYLRVLQK
ncbi:MAG: c-type cytochrome [Magnetococcales bacterium]|nr:c-type cytochrome [Magnetococcales bacterium]MBF0440149.1 c-type cytochrome [Magnetococcales bacterium]